MSVSVRKGWACRLPVVMGLAVMALVFAPGARAATPQDTVTATGLAPGVSIPPVGPPFFNSINISAHSDPSGQNAAGTASFILGPAILSGTVTCLSVTGPDQGGGTAAAPTNAVLNFVNTTGTFFVGSVITVGLIDNGGNGTDVMSAAPLGRSPTDCSPLAPSPEISLTMSQGRAVVYDAPTMPTSKEQCMDGGWQSFGVFKNQGECIEFVETGK